MPRCFLWTSYYRDLSQFPLDSRHKTGALRPPRLRLESELIIEHVRALARGETIQRPGLRLQDAFTRVAGKFDTIIPKGVVTVEGILALHFDELVPLYDFSIYVNAPNEICLKRRIYRDMLERGRTEQSVREQFEATAKPMADLYVVPSAARASLIVEGTDSLDWSVEQVLKGLNQAGLTPQ